MSFPVGHPAMEEDQSKASVQSPASKRSAEATRPVSRRRRKDELSSSSSGEARSGPAIPKGEQQAPGPSRRPLRAHLSRTKEPTGPAGTIITRSPAAFEFSREGLAQDQCVTERAATAGQPRHHDEYCARTGSHDGGPEFSEPAGTMRRLPSTLSLAERRALEGPALTPACAPVVFRVERKEVCVQDCLRVFLCACSTAKQRPRGG
ncbi:uncharacterized protein LOC144119242 [Amblyomma americanum]